MTIKRGDVFFANLEPVVGSEQGGCRPVVILQNDIGNYYSHTTIVAAFTKRLKNMWLPTHIKVDNYGLKDGSVALLEQIRTIDIDRLERRVGKLSEEDMKNIDRAINISLGIYGG